MNRVAQPPRDGMRRSWSLTTRLTLWYAAASFVAVLTSTLTLLWLLLGHLDAEDDQMLLDRLQLLRPIVEAEPFDADAVRTAVTSSTSSQLALPIFVRVLRMTRPAQAAESEDVLAETSGFSPELPPAELSRRLTALADAPSTNISLEWETASGRSFRVQAIRVHRATAPTDVMLLAALDRTHEEQLLKQYRWNVALVLSLAMLGCGFVGHQLARRSVRPLREIIDAAKTIRSTTLHERITAHSLPAELADLAETFNDMLQRLEDSFERLSRFSSDVAHELRTPVNNLLGQAEVTLTKPRTLDDYRDALVSAWEEGQRLSRMIDSLLFLARAEHPATQLRRERLDIAHELRLIADFHEAAATEAGVTLTVEAPESLFGNFDRTLLQQALGNLLCNALAHTPRGGRITLAARLVATSDNPSSERLQIEVTDTGCGIPADHLPHVFDRLYRVDHSRNSTTGGLGLGLTIAKTIATLHGGRIEIQSAVNQGTSVSIYCPATCESSALTK